MSVPYKIIVRVQTRIYFLLLKVRNNNKKRVDLWGWILIRFFTLQGRIRNQVFLTVKSVYGFSEGSDTDPSIKDHGVRIRKEDNTPSDQSWHMTI